MMHNKLLEALEEVISLLRKHEVEYMMIGGTTVGYYGYQRISGAGYSSNAELTPDLDFWYKPTNTNYYRLVGVIKELGLDTKSLEELVFHPKKTFIRIQRDKYRLEFLCDIKGVEEFAKCYNKSKEISLNQIEFRVIGYEDLIKNKEATTEILIKGI
jgi:predicted nucleotidyltransferase